MKIVIWQLQLLRKLMTLRWAIPVVPDSCLFFSYFTFISLATLHFCRLWSVLSVECLAHLHLLSQLLHILQQVVGGGLGSVALQLVLHLPGDDRLCLLVEQNLNRGNKEHQMRRKFFYESQSVDAFENRCEPFQHEFINNRLNEADARQQQIMLLNRDY